MTRNSTIHPVSIGNGLFVRTRRPKTIGEAYRDASKGPANTQSVTRTVLVLPLWASDAIHARGCA